MLFQGVHLSQVHQPSKLFCVFCVFRGNICSPTDFTEFTEQTGRDVLPQNSEFTEQTGRGCSPTDFTDSHRWCVFGVLCVLRVPWDLLRPQWICENLCNLWEDYFGCVGHCSVGAFCSVGALLALASGKAERRQVHPLQRHEAAGVHAAQQVAVEQRAGGAELVDVAVGGVGAGVGDVHVGGEGRDVDCVWRLH